MSELLLASSGPSDSHVSQPDISTDLAVGVFILDFQLGAPSFLRCCVAPGSVGTRFIKPVSLQQARQDSGGGDRDSSLWSVELRG